MKQRLYSRKEAILFLGLTKDQWYRGKLHEYLSPIPAPGSDSRVLYDYYELNALADTMKKASVRPKKELTEWDNENHRASQKEAHTGTSTSSLTVSRYEKARKKVISARR